MEREDLLDQLRQYQPYDAREAVSLSKMIDFVESHADCFCRELRIGHLTGSAWLLNPAGDRVLLTHHRKLNLWLQLGGHADGQTDLLRVAMREAEEESGIQHLRAMSRAIFDLDVHDIPARGSDPAHQHYDVRFLLQAVDSDRFIVSEESHDLRWFTADEIEQIGVDVSVRRMNSKWQNGSFLLGNSPHSVT